MLFFASLANNFKQSWKSDDKINYISKITGRGDTCNSFKTSQKNFHQAGKKGAWPQTYL